MKRHFFYPFDLVNTKTTIPLRVGEERWIYTLTLRVSVYIHHYSPPLRGIVVYYSCFSFCSSTMKVTKVITVVFSLFSYIKKYFLHKICHSFLFAVSLGKPKYYKPLWKSGWCSGHQSRLPPLLKCCMWIEFQSISTWLWGFSPGTPVSSLLKIDS